MSISSRFTMFVCAVIAVAPSGLAAAEDDKPRTDLYGDPLPPGAVARLGSIRFQHPYGGKGRIESLAFSPDGKRLASATSERVILWERSTGKRLREFKIDDWRRIAVGFDAESRLQVLRIERSDRTRKITHAVLWRPEVKNDFVRLELDEDSVGRIFAFSPDGKRLLTAGREAASVWDVRAGKRIGEPLKIAEWRNTAALSADYRMAAFATADGRGIELVDLQTRKIVRHWNAVVEDLSGQIRGLAFLGNGKTLFSTDGILFRVWEVNSGKMLRQWEREDTDFASIMAMPADGKTLATVGIGYDSTSITLWDAGMGKKLRFPGVESKHLHTLAFTQPNRVVTINSPGLARFWDTQSGKCLRSLGPKQGIVDFTAVSPRGEWLAGWIAPGHFAVWDVAAGKIRWQIKTPYPSLWSLRFSSDGKMLMGQASGENQMFFLCWNAATGKRLARQAIESHVSDYYFSRDGTTMTLRNGRNIQRFRIRPNGTLHRLGEAFDLAKRSTIRDLSPDGRTLLVSEDETRLVSWNENQRLSLVEAASGTAIGWLQPGEREKYAWFAASTFSADGSRVAAAYGGAVHLWDVATRKEVERFAKHEYGALKVVVSPDNQWVASEGADHTVLIWKCHPPRVRKEPTRPSPLNVGSLWDDLANPKAETAWPALRKLTRTPQQAVPFLQSHLPPARKGDARRLASLIAELDSETFAVRQKAYRELEQQGERAEDALEETLERKPSLEMRKRILELLEKREKARGQRTPDNLRVIRAVQVLETIGTAESRQVLQKLSEGAGGALRTAEARAALRRMAK